ncbi:uncharacterized protein ASCRUDRAFT_6940, partial [Ascoidea rubescens DSM 1968]
MNVEDKNSDLSINVNRGKTQSYSEDVFQAEAGEEKHLAYLDEDKKLHKDLKARHITMIAIG